MSFAKLSIKDWRQFSTVDIDFHPRVTIITGANGAGKSTLLKILSQHFGWSQTMLATPVVSEKGVTRYITGLFDWFLNKSDQNSERVVGSIIYGSRTETPLTVPAVGGLQYNLNISRQQHVFGLHINSHRPMMNYQQVGNIPMQAIDAENAFNAYSNETRTRYNNGHSQFGPTYRMKEALISMAMFGPGNANVHGNPVLAKLFADFKLVLKTILPPSVGFKDISVRIPDVVLVTETGEFVLDAASGGLMSLIDLAWQIFLYSQNKESFTVTFDEPENHLHPSMQRSLVGNLLNAFPRAQFIIVTHSPFVVSSVKDSAVYVLRYDPSPDAPVTGMSRRISSVALDQANKAGTASEILRDVLGVPVTLPIWAEDDLKLIADRFQIQELNPAAIDSLRSQLDEAGLGEFYPDALRRIAGRN